MGLSSDLTWRHCDGLDPSLITAAQLATNVTNLLLSLRMYRRTMTVCPEGDSVDLNATIELSSGEQVHLNQQGSCCQFQLGYTNTSCQESHPGFTHHKIDMDPSVLADKTQVQHCSIPMALRFVGKVVQLHSFYISKAKQNERSWDAEIIKACQTIFPFSPPPYQFFW